MMLCTVCPCHTMLNHTASCIAPAVAAPFPTCSDFSLTCPICPNPCLTCPTVCTQLERNVPADGEPAHLLFTARQFLLQRLGLCAAPDAAARSILSPGVFLVDRHCILERKHGTNSWPFFHLLAVDVLGAPGEPPDPILNGTTPLSVTPGSGISVLSGF